MNLNCTYRRGLEDAFEIVIRRIYEMELSEEDKGKIKSMCEEYLNGLKKLKFEQLHNELKGNAED